MSQPKTFQDEYEVDPRFDFALWRRILRFGKPYRKNFIGLACVAIFLSSLEIALPLLVGKVIDSLAEHGRDMPIGLYLGLFVGFVFCFVCCVLGFIGLVGSISTQISFDIRHAAFKHLQQLHLGYFTERPVGWLMARLTGDCNLLARIMGWAMLDLIWGTCMVVGIALAMLVIHFKLALLMLLIIPPLAIASRWFQWRLLLSSRKVRKANSHLTASFNESIQGIKTTKSLVREKQNLHEFQQLSTTMFDDSMVNARLAAAFLPVLLTICAAATGIALWYGGMRIGDGLTLGQLVMFLGLAAQFTQPVQGLARTITMILGAQASAERIQQVLDTPSDIVDTPEALQRLADHQQEDAPHLAPDGLPARISEIRFEEVSFAYQENQPVLQNCNLTVTPGQTVALVGQTGGGKSTLVNLLCRFYEPNTGHILIDGVDYRQRSLHWFQNQLGVIPQTPQLFSGTIMENIRYGRLDASEEDIIQAAKQVNAHDFISALPDGYGSKVGEGGNQLSTGQKQLIALARAILANPQIFIMDEATSSVDTETEKLIQDAVDHALEDRFAFVIAHRLSTIRNADQILVIDAGQIVEQGTHHDLIAKAGRYYQLYTQQFTQEGEASVLAGG